LNKRKAELGDWQEKTVELYTSRYFWDKNNLATDENFTLLGRDPATRFLQYFDVAPTEGL
jgi:hypothetical protein